MAAKTSWHRRGTKLRHRYPMYTGSAKNIIENYTLTAGACVQFASVIVHGVEAIA